MKLRSRSAVRTLIWAICCLLPVLASAHEVRPGFLQLRATDDGGFDVLWKQPVMQDRRLPLEPVFPEQCDMQQSRAPEHTGDALLTFWTTDCQFDSGVLRINGLSGTLTDVMVQIERPGEAPESFLLRPESPELDLANPTPSALTYLWLGIEHLLLGIDHVLFVIALVLFITDRWMLLKTITAFTLAHSITLALSVLEWVKLPQGPVEAIIALSILFLARELLVPETARSLVTRARPWIMAMVFGLLHGFGFAGALSDIGLPRDQLALSLLLFNVGIEVGQLIVIAATLSLLWLVHRVVPGNRAWKPFAYIMGCVAGMWTIERMLAAI